jgi:MFS family permease
MGVLLDKLGRKKVLIPSLLLFGIAGSLCSTVNSLQVMLGLRIIQGIGWSASIPTTAVLIGDLYRDPRRAEAIGLNNSALGLGSMIYPSVGGIIALISWRTPFLLYLIAIPIAIITALFLEEKPKISSQNNIGKVEFWRVIRQPSILITMGGGFLAFILFFGGLMAYLGIFLENKFGLSPDIRGIYLSFVMMMIILTSLQSRRMVERIPKRWLILTGFAIQGLGFLLMPLPPTPELIIPMLALFGVGRGMTSLMLITYILDSAPEDTRGRVYFIYQIPVKLGQTLGPIIAGILYGLAGVSSIYFWFGGVTLGITLIIFIVTVVKRKKGGGVAAMPQKALVHL